MRAIDIKGVRIGTGQPKTIVSLMAADSRELADGAERLTRPAGSLGIPDCIEWRADYWRDLTPDAVACTCRSLSEKVASQPLVFTCRTTGQGGKANLGTSAYVDICLRVIEEGQPDIVDIETSIGPEPLCELVDAAYEHNVRTLLSQHYFAGMPGGPWMIEAFLLMADLGADICKLAAMAHDEDDCERLMMATREAHRQLGPERDRPFCAIAMGEAGMRSRLEGELFGSALTFCAQGTSSAPGQVELAKAMRAMEKVHAKLSD